MKMKFALIALSLLCAPLAQAEKIKNRLNDIVFVLGQKSKIGPTGKFIRFWKEILPGETERVSMFLLNKLRIYRLNGSEYLFKLKTKDRGIDIYSDGKKIKIKAWSAWGNWRWIKPSKVSASSFPFID